MAAEINSKKVFFELGVGSLFYRGTVAYVHKMNIGREFQHIQLCSDETAAWPVYEAN